MGNRFSIRLATLMAAVVVAATLAVLSAQAQKFSDWSAPVNLGPIINSGVNNQHPGISKNGLSLYFSSDRPGTFGKLDIWVSQRPTLDAPWGTPQNLGPNINTGSTEFSPAFTPDGHWMYFHSDRPGGCGGLDLYVSHRKDKSDDFGWEPAQNLGCVINSIFNDAGPTFFEDDGLDVTLLYFTSTKPAPPGGGDFDIYVSTLQPDGTWGPGVFVPELSSPFRDTRTAIRRDGLEMFLSSGRPLGSVGSEDLWVSTRASTADPWPPPVNLGFIVNSTAFDGAPALSRDATTLYFFSERPGGFGKRDLYVATRTKLPD